MEPYFRNGNIELYCGDNLALYGLLSYDCVLSDPPWNKTPEWKFRECCPDAIYEPLLNISRWIDRPAILWGADYLEVPAGGRIEWGEEAAWTNLFEHTIRLSNEQFYIGKHHSNETSLDAMLHCVRMMPAGVILDPFAGSGTVLIAAAMLGRKAIGIECNPSHCETAVRRLQGELCLLP